MFIFFKQGKLTRPDFLLSSFLFITGSLLTTYFTAIFYARKEFGIPNKILCSVNGILILLLIFERNNYSIKTSVFGDIFFYFLSPGNFTRHIFFSQSQDSLEFHFYLRDQS